MKEKTRITRTLLEKPKERLTEDERDAVLDFENERERRNKRLEEENDRIAKDCSILCSGMEKNPIPDYGWIRPVKRLCYALENLNYDFKKYGVAVVLDQTKEKYGTLRFYTHVDAHNIGLLGLALRPLDKIVEWMTDIDFGAKVVTDEPMRKTVEWREITKEHFDSKTNEFNVPFGRYGSSVISASSKKDVTEPDKIGKNVYLVEEDGKFFYSYVLYHGAKTHIEYTKHLFLRKLLNAFSRILVFLDRFYKEPKIQSVKIQEMDYRVDELVSNAERECEKLCQHCGVGFGNHYKECETQGWYMYVCQRCADATGMEYRMDGNYYKEGIQVEHDEPKVTEKDDNSTSQRLKTVEIAR